MTLTERADATSTLRCSGARGSQMQWGLLFLLATGPKKSGLKSPHHHAKERGERRLQTCTDHVGVSSSVLGLKASGGEGQKVVKAAGSLPRHRDLGSLQTSCQHHKFPHKVPASSLQRETWLWPVPHLASAPQSILSASHASSHRLQVLPLIRTLLTAFNCWLQLCEGDKSWLSAIKCT